MGSKWSQEGLWKLRWLVLKYNVMSVCAHFTVLADNRIHGNSQTDWKFEYEVNAVIFPCCTCREGALPVGNRNVRPPALDSSWNLFGVPPRHAMTASSANQRLHRDTRPW